MSLRKLISVFALVSLSITISLFIAGCSSNSNSRVANTNTNATATPAPTAGAPSSTTPTSKININTATQADFLRAIPGLGNRMVHEFEEYRPYKSIQQFRKEIGKYVDQTQVADYEKYIFVPIDENQSDGPTLQQIPGLDTAEAQELISGRPYASREAFLTKLGTKVSADELATAKTYLVQQ